MQWPTQVRSGLDHLNRLAAEGKPFPDFILLDLRMPIINGFEFLEKLKAFPQEKLAGTSIHLLTSSLDEHDIERAFTYPHVKGFHSKPLSLKKLQAMVSSPDIIRPGKI
ncbi:MAG: response regulator [Bacteroidota bacterium]